MNKLILNINDSCLSLEFSQGRYRSSYLCGRLSLSGDLHAKSACQLGRLSVDINTVHSQSAALCIVPAHKEMCVNPAIVFVNLMTVN